MATTFHASERAVSRLAAAGIDPRVVLNEADVIARRFRDTSIAVRLRALGEKYGDNRADVMARESNGDEVWMVAREGVVRTVMLRRSTQPRTRDAFGVAMVARVDEK